MTTRPTRRRVLQGGAVGAVALTLPRFLGGCATTQQAMAPAAPEPTANPFMARFGVDDAMLQRVLGVALSRGGDHADLFFEHKLTRGFALEDGMVNTAWSDVDLGVGIRVLVGDQTGYAYTEELTEEAMRGAASTASAIAAAGAAVPPQGFALQSAADHYPVELTFGEAGAADKVALVEDLDARIRARDPRVIKASVSYDDSESWVMVVDSRGRFATDYRPMAYLAASVTAEANGERQSNYANMSGRQGFEFYGEERIERLATQAVERTVGLFDAVRPPGGELPLVLAPGSSGILLHEAIGHGLEADFNRKEISIFSSMVGKKVAEPFVSIVDDATIASARGSLNVDDEGEATENTVLVENGILRGYLHDRISAAHYGIAPTGNGRRQSFRHVPQPRMRNTYMLDGPHTAGEIIASVDRGVYAETFTNGQVQIGAGDFTFYIKTGYLIEGGEIAAPIKDTNIIGNGPDVLAKMTMVADDLALSEGGWTCGKGGQGVPVSQGLPTTKVSSIVVGGETS